MILVDGVRLSLGDWSLARWKANPVVYVHVVALMRLACLARDASLWGLETPPCFSSSELTTRPLTSERPQPFVRLNWMYRTTAAICPTELDIEDNRKPAICPTKLDVEDKTEQQFVRLSWM